MRSLRAASTFLLATAAVLLVPSVLDPSLLACHGIYWTSWTP